MAVEQNSLIENHSIGIVNVAVAVIYYQDQYLLGFRAASQHQGNRYEFVGGKIDAHETATQALIREVSEETGLDIANNTAVKLGRLHHDYGDKRVCLQVYCIEVTPQQYEQYRNLSQGLESQKLTWVDKVKLLAGDYDLPAANKTILTWLQLPTQISITYPLAHFNDATNPIAAWVQYHQQHLAADAWVYIRIKETAAEDSIKQLLDLRPDIKAIVPNELPVEKSDNAVIKCQIVAGHSTQTQLMQWPSSIVGSDITCPVIASSLPLIVSCHDKESIAIANQLAQARLRHQLPPVIGLFLSPVEDTQTHPDTPSLGWQAWSKLAELADVPVIGLGGLSPLMSEQAMLHGGIAIAGIRQFFK